MMIFKIACWCLIVAVGSIALIAAGLVLGCLRVIREICKLVWYTLFPKRHVVNFLGELTDEDCEDLFNYYNTGSRRNDYNYIPSEWD